MSERQRGRERETNRQREKKRGREGATNVAEVRQQPLITEALFTILLEFTDN